MSLLVGMMLTVSCARSTTAQIISPQKASTLIQDNRNNPDFVIIDVRTPSEFVDGHIANAIDIDFYATNFWDKINQLDKNKTYLIYCHSGNRSGKAQEMMVELGFQKIYDIGGGIVAWEAAKLPIVK
ncbi:MAG: rhodanese-like domain-containing protein [Chloroflexi bacterium]|nr:rhodanese-like domain-containing protein [Chloroflexota bacterium]